MKNTVLIIMFLAALTTAYAGIEWKNKEVSIDVKPGRNPVEVSFPFTVSGSESVVIISTKTSCGCLVVEPVTGEFKPGAEGIVKARYTPQNGVGTTIEKITVNTTDPGTPEVELRLLVYSPLTYRIDPTYAFWSIGAEPAAKDVYFIAIASKGYKPVSVYSTSAHFTATLIPPEGKSTRYVIRIKPVSTREAHGAFVYIDVVMMDGTIEKRKIMVAIRDPNNPKIEIDAQ